jgi:hypothetical protein
MNKKQILPVDAWQVSREMACSCKGFSEDVDEEWLDEECVSCYNCRYRRFVNEGILCMKSLFKEFNVMK